MYKGSGLELCGLEFGKFVLCGLQGEMTWEDCMQTFITSGSLL